MGTAGKIVLSLIGIGLVTGGTILTVNEIRYRKKVLTVHAIFQKYMNTPNFDSDPFKLMDLPQETLDGILAGTIH